MDDQTYITLQKLGLTDGETRVYLSLVGLGSVTVGPIIDKASISSSKVYVILEKLIQKGLVTYIIKGRTKYFQASNPESLLDYIEVKEKEIEQTKKELLVAMRQIETIQKSNQRIEEAIIYRGYKGIKTAWLEAIKTIPKKGKYLFFSKGYGTDMYLKQFFRDVSQKLDYKKIKIKGLANNSEKKVFRNYYKSLGYSMRYTKMSWPSDITIAGNFLLTFVWDKKEPVVYATQSTALVNSYKKFFKDIWKEAKV